MGFLSGYALCSTRYRSATLIPSMDVAKTRSSSLESKFASTALDLASRRIL